LRGGHPEGIGVEEKEEDHAESHEVHVDEEQDTAMIEAPSTLHAADGVDGSSEGDEGWYDEKGIGADGGKARDQEREAKAENYQQNAARKRSAARIEKARRHAIPLKFTDYSMLLEFLATAGDYWGAAELLAGVAAGEAGGADGDGGAVGGWRFFTSEVATSTAPRRSCGRS
jgi:hypothetical protein